MKKPDVSKVVKNAKRTISKHGPGILTGVGIAGMVTTTVLAVRATPKAIELIEAEKRKQEVTKLGTVEVVKTTWKCYIPAAVTGAASITCLVGASTVNARRNAALLTAYKISETALTEYREKVVETIGEKKEKAVRSKVQEERINKNPVSKSEVIITDKGDTLCYDALSGRYFKSDIDRIRKAENELNARMLRNDYISLNDLYSELGLSSINIGDELGWSVDDGMLEIELDSHLADNGTPCIVIDFRRAPRYEFSKFA